MNVCRSKPPTFGWDSERFELKTNSCIAQPLGFVETNQNMISKLGFVPKTMRKLRFRADLVVCYATEFIHRTENREVLSANFLTTTNV